MKVLCYGSLNIDRNYYVDDFVKAGETIQVNDITESAGGKGLNQALALARAGVNVYQAGKIGYDGNFLVEMLEAAGGDCQFVRQDPKQANGHALIQKTPAGANAILVFGGTNTSQKHSEMDEVLTHFAAGDILLIQNEINALTYLVDQAHAKGLLIYFNPSPMNVTLANSILEKLTGLILNEHEAYALTGESDPEAILDTFRERYPNLAVILTLGEAGACYTKGDLHYQQAAIKCKTVDTTGAGDTFTGYYLAGLVSGLSIPACLKQAAYASALAVQAPGAAEAIPQMADVQDFMAANEA